MSIILTFNRLHIGTKMPKVKTSPSDHSIGMKESKSLVIKSETENATNINLNKFKFQKKPHIKVEYEKDDTRKVEPDGLWEPPNWKEFLVNLRIMRSNFDAPVDSMGCHMSSDPAAAPEVIRYQHLISLMLSSQTKDQVNFAAMKRLRERGLNIDNILNMSDDELGKLIYPVGFWRTKVKYIKKTTQILKDQYNGDIPDSVEKLCKLSGVGPKMAHICMLVAWNKTTGIGVDTHVHRISNRIGWVRKPTSTPEDTRKALQSWLPYNLWSEVNHLMVGFGQTICQPINPKCDECLNRDICPSKGVKSPNKKSPLKSPSKLKLELSDNDFEEVKLKHLSPHKKATKRLTPTKSDEQLVKQEPKDKGKENEITETAHKDEVAPKRTKKANASTNNTESSINIKSSNLNTSVEMSMKVNDSKVLPRTSPRTRSQMAKLQKP